MGFWGQGAAILCAEAPTSYVDRAHRSHGRDSALTSTKRLEPPFTDQLHLPPREQGVSVE